MTLTKDSDPQPWIFESITHGRVNLEEAIVAIKLFLEEEVDAQYSLVIGTDSHEKLDQSNQKRLIHPITAVVVHRKGFGGKYFWMKQDLREVHSLREKIYAETLSSLNFATTFVPSLKKSLNGISPNYNLEIHVDVGEHGDTRDMIKEIIGMVTGNGFIAKTKPFAYAATYVADKHT